MSLINKIKQAEQNLINLTHVKIIKKSDEIHPEWLTLKEEYKKAKKEHLSIEGKCVISIINSILHQRRLIFCITRESLKELLKSDLNWGPNGLRFDNNRYAKIKALLMNSGTLIEIKPGGYKIPTIFKLVNEEYRKFLIVDENAQLQETEKFVSKFEKKEASNENSPKKVVNQDSKSVEISKSLNSLTPEDALNILNTAINQSDLEDYNLKSFEIDGNRISLNQDRKIIDQKIIGGRSSFPVLEVSIKFLELNNIPIKHWLGFLGHSSYINELTQILKDKSKQLKNISNNKESNSQPEVEGEDLDSELEELLKNIN